MARVDRRYACATCLWSLTIRSTGPDTACRLAQSLLNLSRSAAGTTVLGLNVSAEARRDRRFLSDGIEYGILAARQAISETSIPRSCGCRRRVRAGPTRTSFSARSLSTERRSPGCRRCSPTRVPTAYWSWCPRHVPGRGAAATDRTIASDAGAWSRLPRGLRRDLVREAIVRAVGCSIARSGRITLTAHGRRSTRCSAKYTWPMPPLPSSCFRLYGPSWRASNTACPKVLMRCDP